MARRADRRDRLLASCGLARVDQNGHHHGLAVLLRGDERQRRGLQHVRNHGQVLGRRICRADQAGDHVGARREHQHSAYDMVDLVQPQTESGHDAEVAAAAPEGPEEIGMRVLVHVEMLAVGGHHFSREHVVDGEAVLADEEADAAASVIPPRPTLAVSPSPVARPRSPVALV